MLRICCVALSIFASAIIASARADEFPIKKFSPFTYVVDYEASWSPDSRQIVLVSSRHGGTDAAGEFVNPRWSPDGTKIMCASPGRHEPGDFSRANITPSYQLSLICTQDLLTPHPGKDLCRLR